MVAMALQHIQPTDTAPMVCFVFIIMVAAR